MDRKVSIPELPHQASVVGQTVEFGVDKAPLWIEIVQEVQRWS